MKKIIVSVLSGMILSASMGAVAANASEPQAREQVPAQFMIRYRQQIQDKANVIKLSEDKQQQLLEMKVNLYHQQQTANAEFPNDKQARDAARKENRRSYNADLNKMLTRKQRSQLHEWRRAQRNS